MSLAAALSGSGGARAADTVPQPVAQPITWGACKPKVSGVQCGVMPVPLDYTQPSGQRIGIDVIRRPAADPARRLGSLVFNPGGPGASGVAFLRSALEPYDGQIDPAMARLGRRYDLVSFDPRGVGGSQPVRCGKDADWSADSSLARMKKDLQRFIGGCARRSGSRLPFLGTADVARDLEQLRASLGDPKLNFVGYSYGTYLGTVYANLFPASVGRLVLDGGIDPESYANRPLESDLAQSVATQATFKAWLKSTKGKDRISLAGYRRFVRRLDRKPLRLRGVPSTDRLTGDVVRSFVGEAIATRVVWPLAASAVKDAMRGKTLLLSLFLTELAFADGEEDALAGYLANSGVDRAADPAAITADYLRRARLAAPDFADLWQATLAGALWPKSPARYAGPWTLPAIDGMPPVLVIGTRLDPRTPYDGAVALRTQLGNARLLTFEGQGHTAFNNGASEGCIDEYVFDYLLDGAAPADGTSCKQSTGIDVDPANLVGGPLGAPSTALARFARRAF
ncbi:MAG: alpha/beta fold hydrolase [Solirubrobacteraceae bacterium]|nr:alpha/beta fold hydrolase [Solirubrobacteraceae bacterium]